MPKGFPLGNAGSSSCQGDLARVPTMVDVAQLVECLTVTQAVAGSIPVVHPSSLRGGTFLRSSVG